MPEKRTKYDTDPLDPGFARRTEEVFGGQTGQTETAAETERLTPEPQRETPPVEEPTRRFQEKYPTSYPSVFVPPVYQPPPAPGPTSYAPPPPQTQASAPPPVQNPYPPPYGAPPPVVPPGPASFYAPHMPQATRHVDKLGLPENVACILPYAPFYIGLVAGLIELLIVPRAETRTRFHAAQGMAFHLAVLAVTLVFNFIGAVTGNWAGYKLIGIASTIFLLFSMWRVWEGRPHHLQPLDEATSMLNRKIEPRK